MSLVTYEVRDHVAIITLNRPEHLNSVNSAMVDALLEASLKAADDASVRAVVVRGNGDHFMAGGDLKWFQEQTRLPEAACRACFEDLLGRVHAAVLNFRRMDKPVIAAVHGAVAGFGLSLMMSADLAVAAENAYFTLAYSNIALSPDGGATWSLPRQVGLKQAMEIALLGERFDAARARELGLVNRVVPLEQLESEAMKLAIRLAGGSAGALARTKALINQSSGKSLEAQLLDEQASFTDCATHPDFSEGLAGFFERRKPVYRKG
jgi:2-(1,2-epoxy-1,2-dihydrophenyl)acetyl-CoA isomerase